MRNGESAQSAVAGRVRGGAASRGVVIVLSLLWLLAVSVVGVLQPPWPDPLAAPPFMTLDWWRYPVERNAPLRLPLIGGELRGLHVAADGRSLWVVGDRGLILHSDDAGAHWQRRALAADTAAPPPPPPPRAEPAKASALWFISDAQAAMAADKAANTAYDPKIQSQQIQQRPTDSPVQTQGGVEAPRPTPPTLLRVPASPEATKQAEAAAAAQKRPPPTTKTTTPPPATSPTPPANTPPAQAARPAPPADLLTVSFDPAGRIGLIGAGDGNLYGTQDGGDAWQALQRFDGAVLAVAVRADGSARLITGKGAVYLRDAAGGVWRIRADIGPLVDAAIDAQSGRMLAVTAAGRTADSTDDGASWRDGIAPLAGRGRVLQLRADGETWGGQRGVWMVRSGASPLFLGTPVGAKVPDARLYAVRQAGTRYYAVGEQGSIFTRADESSVWRPLSSGRAGALRELRIAANGAGTAIGAVGIRYLTEDGGRSWAPQSAQYRRLPAPWLWLAWTLGLAALVAATLRRPPPQAGVITDTAADAFVSDKPLAAAREDRLDFAPLAWGLSAFLRNEKTDAPLTIAITGDWGSGKSSLMGLLKEDLRRFGVRSVWFNAWHHQKEEALLAALLTSIRDQAIPGWFSFEGLEYRLRLSWTRGRRYWPLSFAVAFSIGVIGWALTHPGTVLDNWLTLADDLWSALFDDKSKADPDSLMTRLRATGLAAGALAPLVGALLRMRAFGVDPAALAASISSRATVKDLGSQASFRQTFAEQFAEVTDALEPRTMLVLIDDLDRCKPEAVLEVMEAVNFLVSSGRVYVVLGMARARVEACVGIAFEKVAHELVEAESAKAAVQLPGEDQDVRARRIRREYAQQYLEKLINIEVPVPKLDPLHSARLQDEIGSVRPIFEPSPGLRRVCRLWPVLVGGLAIWAGAWLGSQLPLAVQRQPAPLPAVVQTAARPPADVPAVVAPIAASSDSASQGPVYFTAAVKVGPAWWLPLLLLGIAGGIAALALVRRPNPVVRDSAAFRDALEIWNPVVATALRTPRAVKRFQNRVRYLAMMARHSRRALTFGDELRMWLLRRHEAPSDAPVGDPSPELVAIGALDKALPGWERAPDLRDAVTRVEQADLREALDAALGAHHQRFDLDKVQRFVPLFRRIANGVRLEAAPAESVMPVAAARA